ncbi:putative coiled coil domain protein (partial), partial [Candidatus Ichthyocystis hellenicum]
ELIQSNINDPNKKLTNKNFISKFIFPRSNPGSEKKSTKINYSSKAKKIKSSANRYIATDDWYVTNFIKNHLFLNERFEQTSNHKKLIVNSSAEMESIIKNKEELRKHDLKARDNLIRIFMQYYLSVRDKFKYICQSRFKIEPELLNKEFELPLPKEDSFLEKKSISDNHRCKITADMEIIRNRMSNYLSKRRHKKSVGIYREETGILIRDSYKIYTVRFKNMENVSASDSILRNISSDEKEKIGKDIITHKSDGNSTYKIPHRSFNFIYGINISPGITNVDPELVSHRDVADIILSLENKDVSKYLAAMNSFTAKFMCKSLQYIRALKVDLHDYNDSYLINPNTDEYIVQSRGIYTKLQYICDYFKYYVLGSQLEFFAYYEEVNVEEKTLHLLTSIDDKKVKLELQTEIKAEEVSVAIDDEYEMLIESVKKECLDLKENRKKLIAEINEHKTKIRSLLKPLDLSIRDELIKCLMEYYLSIVDKFESMAEEEFKNISRPINERLVLPIPQAVAEIAHKEIQTGQTLYNYYVGGRSNFFCEGNTCLCTRSRLCDTSTVIKRHILERVIYRMREYILSLTIKDDGEIVHNSVQLFW